MARAATTSINRPNLTYRDVPDMGSSFGARSLSDEGLDGVVANGTGAIARCQESGPVDDHETTVQNPERMPPDSSPAAGETIGERLKRLRLEQGFSQRELAAPGVSYAYISRIEAGTRQPSVKALRRLAAKLGVSADYLETGSDLDAGSARELRLADLELAVRLGDWDDVERPLNEVLTDALSVGAQPLEIHASVALASIALERGEFASAVSLLEAAVHGEPFAPVERV